MNRMLNFANKISTNLYLAIMLCAAYGPIMAVPTNSGAVSSQGDMQDSAVLAGFFSTDKSVIAQEKCFSGRYENYESAQQPVNGKHTLMTINFKLHFPEREFEHYRNDFECYQFSYKVDQVVVQGHFIKAKTAHQGKRPVVIFNRGGNDMTGPNNFSTLFNRLFPLADQGFIVIASQLRGARVWPQGGGFDGGRDEFGGKDVDDVRALLPVLAGVADADMNRVGMMGVSRGGMMTWLASKNNPAVKAIAIWAGQSDMAIDLPARPDFEEHVLKRLIPDYAGNKVQALKERSVLHWLDQVPATIPVLLLHGDRDTNVLLENSIRLAEKLKARGQPTKLVVYPGLDHAIGIAAPKEIYDWFKTYL